MINKFLNYLKKNKIDFCIINGYQNIGINKNSDNDILLRKKDFKNIEKIILDFCNKNEFLYVQNYFHDIYAKNIFLFDPISFEILNLDLYGELSRNNFIFFSENKIFENLYYYNNLPILSPEKEFIFYLYKKLDKDDLNKDIFLYLKNLWNQNNESIQINLKEFFKTTNNIIIEAFTKEDINILLINRKNILKDINIKNKFTFKRKFLNYKRILYRISNPTGLCIAFLGPDGSGKSTIIKNILNRTIPFRRKDYFHLKPFKTNLSKKKIVNNPHQYPPYNKFKSYLKLLYFIYQYNYGWIKNILPLKIKSSLIIFDRYYDDLLIDNKRYRYGGDIKIAKFIKKFIPKPDLYFILIGDANLIYERKKEVPLSELKKQIEKYKELINNKNYIKIDVSKSPDEITNIVLKKILEKTSERYK